MNQQLKQRLAGSIVLVLLAVIFLPMLLKRPGSVQPEPQVRNFEIEQQSRADRQTVRIPDEVIRRYESSDSTEYGSEQREDPDTNPFREGLHTGDSLSNNLEGSKEDDSSREEEPGSSAARQEMANTAKVADGNTNGIKTGWAIQLGSFLERENAERLIRRLADHQLDAYIEALESNKRTIYRVRIGPMTTKDKAQSVKAKIERQEGFQVLIVSLDQEE